MEAGHFAGAGAVSRAAPIRDRQELGPWRGRVRIVPVEGLRSAGPTTLFEVSAEWSGPGLPGLPKLPAGVKSDARDIYVVASVERARRIARRAERELSAAIVPDLRAIAATYP